MHLDPGPLVVVLVLAAAVLHATWNAIAHSAEDRLVGFALISTSTLVLGTVMVLVGEPVGWHYFWLAALSAALHVAYLLLLMASYQVADLSRAYPLSTGHRRRPHRHRLRSCCRALRSASTWFSAPASWSSGLIGVTLAGPRLTRSPTTHAASRPRSAPASRSRATRSSTASPSRAALRSSRTPAG